MTKTTTTPNAIKVKLFILFAHFILLLNGQQEAPPPALHNNSDDDPISTWKEQDEDFETGCHFLANIHWKLVCGSVYSRELKLKYKDRIVNEGVPYKVWQDADAPDFTHLLITFYKSKLFACHTLQYANEKFYCDNKVAPLKLPHSQVHCLPFIFSYADNLRERCQRAPHRVRAAASAIQYARHIADDANAPPSFFKHDALIIFFVNFIHFAVV